jgi:hypothetical protein
MITGTVDTTRSRSVTRRSCFWISAQSRACTGAKSIGPSGVHSKCLKYRLTATAWLNFPKTHKIDWVSAQHVEKMAPDEFNRTPPEAQGMKEGEELWEVEKVIRERVYGRRRHRQLLVKWKHWPTNRATWEFEANLQEDMDKEALGDGGPV